MRRNMIVGLLPIAMSATTLVRAAPVTAPLRPLEVATLPERCRPLAAVPQSATIPDPDFAAHISVANCSAEEAMAKLTPHADQASMAALEAAAAPSLAILDDVIAHGDVRWSQMATDARSDLLVGMVVRMRIVANDPSDRDGLEAKLARWLNPATRTKQEAGEAPPTILR